MAKYKVQHWLPSGYMKFFSISGGVEGRKSKIYYSNGTGSKIKSVEKLSCSNYHYSRTDTEAAETSFHEMENDYPLIVEKIIKGNDLVKTEYFGLILTMIDFHARNPSYENLTKKENYKAFEIVSRGLITEIFKDSEKQGSDLTLMSKFLETNWLLQPIFSDKEEFISSDHPSLIFSTNGEVAFIFLPISPHFGIVAVDKRKIEITGNTANEKDNGILNALQAAKCITYVYSNIDLSTHIGEGKPLTKWFKKERPKGFVTDDSWKPEFIDYKKTIPVGLSFLKNLI